MFPQFGDDMIGGFLNAHEALAQKRRNMVPYHIGRLSQDGFLPMNAVSSQVPATRATPADQATQAFDNPPPPPPPQAAEPMFEDIESGGELAQSNAQRSIGNTFMQGAGSAAADVGAGVVHGLTYGVAAGSAAVAKGVFRGLAHFATGTNPLSVDDYDDDEELIPDEPLRVLPRAKAQSRSSGSQESMSPYPYPFDVAPYNGTGAYAISINDEVEAPAAAAAAAIPRNRLAQRDTQLARDTMAGLGPNVGRGQRRR